MIEIFNKSVNLIYTILQRLILIMCNNYVQIIKYAVFIKYRWINGQINIYATHFILYDFFSGNLQDVASNTLSVAIDIIK